MMCVGHSKANKALSGFAGRSMSMTPEICGEKCKDLFGESNGVIGRIKGSKWVLLLDLAMQSISVYEILYS